MHKYTDDEKKFLYEFVPGHSHKEIWQAFNNKFSTDIPLSAIKQSIMRYNLNTGRTGRFPLGNVPHNKGVKGLHYSPASEFKKGNIPANHREVGSERINKDGYIEIKVSEPNKWELKHRVVWEQVNGDIPKGYAVLFKDQNKLNCNIDNLMLVSRAELVKLNQNKLLYKNSQLTEIGVTIAKIMVSSSERSKHKCKI